MGKPTPYRASVVVPLPDEDVIARSFGNGYDPDTALNVLKMMSGTGDLFPALLGMVKAVFGEHEIDASVTLTGHCQGVSATSRRPG